jgi:hypothetical protein
MAVGADRSRVMVLVIREGVLRALTGVTIGIGPAPPAIRWSSPARQRGSS